MSNLDYSIALLDTEKRKISTWHRSSSENQMLNVNLQDGLTRAVDLLLKEKRKDEKKEFKKEVELKKREKSFKREKDALGFK